MRKVLIPITCLLFLITFGGTASASTVTNTYQDVTVSITAPDTVAPNTDFSVSVNGFITGGGSFDVFAYSFKENGVSIDGSGFNWGYSYSKIIPSIKQQAPISTPSSSVTGEEDTAGMM